MRTKQQWAETSDDLRLLASLLTGDGPLALSELEAGLELGLDLALDAIATQEARRKTAARVFAGDRAARAEFGKADNLEGYLIQRHEQASGVERRHVEPLSDVEAIALCRRTKHQVDGTTEARAPARAGARSAPAAEQREPQADAVPTLDDLARRLGFTRAEHDGDIWSLLEQRRLRPYRVDGQMTFGLHRLIALVADEEDRPTEREKAAARQLEKDLLAYVQHHEPEALQL